MNHLLDTDICTLIVQAADPAFLRFSQVSAPPAVSVVSITELERWLLRSGRPLHHQRPFFALLRQVSLIDVTEPIAHRAALVGHGLRSQQRRIGLGDALIAATALERGLTLVTHSTQVFAGIPGLTVEDWSVP
jgi:predicted nucleic acid-binding protein